MKHMADRKQGEINQEKKGFSEIKKKKTRPAEKQKQSGC